MDLHPRLHPVAFHLSLEAFPLHLEAYPQNLEAFPLHLEAFHLHLEAYHHHHLVRSQFFLNVGPPLEDIIFDHLYGLYFNQQVHIYRRFSCRCRVDLS